MTDKPTLTDLQRQAADARATITQCDETIALGEEAKATKLQAEEDLETATVAIHIHITGSAPPKDETPKEAPPTGKDELPKKPVSYKNYK